MYFHVGKIAKFDTNNKVMRRERDEVCSCKMIEVTKEKG
jgi:hypothetical protein